MTDTTIRLSTDTKVRLDLHRREGESYDDVLRRLTERDRWAGFGALSDSGIEPRTEMQRVRRAMREGGNGGTEDGNGGTEDGSDDTEAGSDGTEDGNGGTEDGNDDTEGEA